MNLEGHLASYSRTAHVDQDSDPFADKGEAIVSGFFVRRLPGFRWRSAEGLLLTGACLEPWLATGDVVFYDRSIEPRDRDLVAALLWYKTGSGSERRAERRVTVKQYREVAGRSYLVAGDGFLRADDVEILGPVIGWQRRSWWRRPPVRKLHFDLPVKGRC